MRHAHPRPGRLCARLVRRDGRRHLDRRVSGADLPVIAFAVGACGFAVYVLYAILVKWR